ncbi:MAG: PAS domain S-box protein [Nitrospirae bacterium]|nr:PAS domain S-box protein [Nitrospirota bacterium]
MNRKLTSGIFIGTVIASVAVSIVAVAIAVVYLTEVVGEFQIANIRERLVAETGLIAERASGIPEPGLVALVGELKKFETARITFIASDGVVAADSEADPASMENHAGRPEIQQAIMTGSGSSIHQSRTTGGRFLYVARIIGNDNGFVRLAAPLDKVYESVAAIRIRIIVAMGLLFLLAGAVVSWRIFGLERAIAEIDGFAASLAGGKLASRLIPEEGGPLSGIAGSLNSIATGFDETTRRNEEEKERLRIILENMPESLLIIDHDGVVTLANPAAMDYFGSSTLKGHPVAEIVRSPEFFALMDDVRRSLQPGEREIGLNHNDERMAAAKVSPFFHTSGEPHAYVAVFHDITRLKKLEQSRRDFVANVSHEIRTPVAAISGFADTLLDGALDDRENAVRFLRIVKTNSERINNLVEDLLTISTIERGEIGLKIAPVELGRVTDGVFAALECKAAGKGIELASDIADDAREVAADEFRLAQILTNLVENGIKFTTNGGVTVSSRRGHGAIVIAVTDTGMGISPRHLPRLGERFYRVDESRSRELGGTGLGLAIVKHLVRAHGWNMRIASEEGRGTRVEVTIPAAVGAASAGSGV